ncbi:putative protoheme IX farnesyltransferase mitochondrial precursor [Suhomyces tanzawaensis NRRL Y-17324]|uniref:Protoheme IX farnesyltransferase, mitochondrial n=1 Tax=Suhomyces tanzawaensis NRRL Y-17324 TaxID=984487 RepID=A0A1E4SL41_9ASCO|nr:putative protoheme IX farnesyltransferase mitochondrial precursor [Suhomyces tanzawaensis NRRL Y-17324]ODV80231.1 putative protoheme IX farnesyltransferase mitochondrial precursor [Suhomyces tanzawaensis NRRL Y-17324]
MSSRMLSLYKLNPVGHFNFFFKNTKKGFRIDQNFINNQHLTSPHRRLLISSKRNSGRNDVSANQETNSILGNVATKVLNCQDPDAELSQKISYDKVPFKVVPKGSTRPLSNKNTTIKPKSELSTLISPYLKLTKPNLTVLVTLSSICSYAISPFTVSLHELLFLTMGTALCSGAANAINMGREPEFDRKMPRTVGRPVVRGLISPQQAYRFAGVTGSLGCTMLYLGVNPTVSMLGFLNIVLYAWIYTSLKRKSIINTWVGAIVGAIPPLMGWAAASPLNHPAAWCLAGLLYAWQFPHFNALSHNIADQYKQAGYVMTAAENPKLNARVALRYSLLMFPLCFGLTYYGITDWVFPIDSAIANGWLTYLAYQFWRQQQKNYRDGAKPTAEGIALAGVHAKQLFWCSVWHLPAVLILAMLHKKGQWDRLWIYLGFSTDSTSSKPLSSY